MNKQEVIQYLDEIIMAAGILRDKALDDNRIQVGYFFCMGVDNKPAIQLYKSVRYIADMLGIGVVQKEHGGDDHHEIGIMYKGWYLYELEDNDEHE